MVDLKIFLEQLSKEDLLKLKNNPSLIEEIINEKSYNTDYDVLEVARSYKINKSLARIMIPPYKIITDVTLAKELLAQDGLLYFQLSPELKENKELITIAFYQNPYILYTMEERLLKLITSKSPSEIKKILEETIGKENMLKSILNTVTEKDEVPNDLKELKNDALELDREKIIARQKLISEEIQKGKTLEEIYDELIKEKKEGR